MARRGAILGRPREEYLADAKGRDLAAFYLFLAMQEYIAHGYARIDHGRIYNEASTGIRAMREFLSAMAREAGL